jgi:DNA adenine methylase
LSEAHLRLARVFIECKPYAEVIERFDKAGTLFYVDPPYWGNERDYGDGLFAARTSPAWPSCSAA